MEFNPQETAVAFFLQSETFRDFISSPLFPGWCRSSDQLWCSGRIQSSHWWRSATFADFESAKAAGFVPPAPDPVPCWIPFQFPRRWGTAFRWWLAPWGSLCWTWWKWLGRPPSTTPGDLDGRQCQAFPPVFGIPPQTRCCGLVIYDLYGVHYLKTRNLQSRLSNGLVDLISGAAVALFSSSSFRAAVTPRYRSALSEYSNLMAYRNSHVSSSDFDFRSVGNFKSRLNCS